MNPLKIPFTPLHQVGRMTNDTAAALGKWFALLNGLRPWHCVSCNAMLVSRLTVEHGEEIAAAANGGRPALRKGDDAGDVITADYGIIEITHNIVDGGIAIRECGETVFRIDPERGTVEGRWSGWIVTLAALPASWKNALAGPAEGICIDRARSAAGRVHPRLALADRSVQFGFGQQSADPRQWVLRR